MAKFNQAQPLAQAARTSVLRSTGRTTPTYEGGVGHIMDAKSELFLTAVATMGNENTFYESGNDRLNRIADLVKQVTADDPAWMQSLIPWLRGPQGNMRSVPIVMAVEYALAGGPQARAVLRDTLQRADEPGEVLAYLFTRHGRKIPAAVKRGVADAASKLYNEYGAMKYDGVGSNSIRLGDVIELTHPKPREDWQSALFEYLLDRRHHSTELRVELDRIPMVKAARDLQAVPSEQRREVLRTRPDALKSAGFTWEQLSGWLPGGMDAEAWESILGPEAKGLGYMALIRNLRNFSQAGVKQSIVDAIVARIKDPEEVARSRQFPFRFLSAYDNSTIEYAHALEVALAMSTQNIPDLSGSLIVIDTSSSMATMGVSRNSDRQPIDVASVMAMSTLARSKNSDVAIFGDGAALVTSELKPTDGVLRGVAKITGMVGNVGHYSNGWLAVRRFFDPAKHKRAIIFSDGQLSDSDPGLQVCPNVYFFMVGGYRVSPANAGKNGRFVAGGFTDTTFKMIALTEAGREARWPWQIGATV